jgi:chemotaxis protein MotB
MSVSSKSKLTIAEQAKRLKNLQDLIENQKEVVNKLKRSVADALVSFDATELSIYIKDGSVYVSLEEKLLLNQAVQWLTQKEKKL